MERFFNIIQKGVSLLMDLVPKWLASSEEERRELEVAADAAVEGLRDHFKKADARDAANFGRGEEATKP